MNDLNMVRLALPEDWPAVQQIADTQFGAEYLTEDAWDDVANKPNSGFGLVAQSGDTIIGFAFNWCLPPTLLSGSILRLPVPTDWELTLRTIVGLLKTVAVAPDAQHQGAATALVSASLDVMGQRGIDHVVSTTWLRKTGSPIGGVLARAGFEPYARVEGYWAGKTERRAVHCPECGAPPCSCPAAVWSRKA